MDHQTLKPIDPREAFSEAPCPDSESDYSLAASQAAMLLALRAGVLNAKPIIEECTAEAEKEGFPIPELKPLQRRRRLKVAEATRYLGISPRELEQETAPQFQDQMNKITIDLYQKSSIDKAAALFEAAMFSEHPLVAVAAAAGARETTRLRKHSRNILEQGTESPDALTARLAQAALGMIDPASPLVGKHVIEPPKSKKRTRESNTAVVTHGTFASDSKWYRPNGKFYETLKTNRPDLHVHDTSFTWSGGYSNKARDNGAKLLKTWITDQGLGTPDFFAHSHGGTVAHLATNKGVQFDRLVLMGWPVHDKWHPNFNNVNRIIDIRVRFDLVILVDGGGQRFRTNQFNIEEHRHGWFDHSSTHQVGYWNKHGLWDEI